MVDDDEGLARTWDGEPISKTSPFGAAIVVYRWHGARAEFLTLHRAWRGPDFAGDWAWGPPSGARHPDEAIERCAARELFEETGLVLDVRRAAAGLDDWIVFLAEAPAGAEIRLSPEHDRYDWLPLEEAAARVTPARVRADLLAAAREIARRTAGHDRRGRQASNV